MPDNQKSNEQKLKEIWTVDGRRALMLVDNCNKYLRVVKDLGPLSKTEFEWVKARPGIPYKKWLEEKKKMTL